MVIWILLFYEIVWEYWEMLSLRLRHCSLKVYKDLSVNIPVTDRALDGKVIWHTQNK